MAWNRQIFGTRNSSSRRRQQFNYPESFGVRFGGAISARSAVCCGGVRPSVAPRVQLELGRFVLWGEAKLFPSLGFNFGTSMINGDDSENWRQRRLPLFLPKLSKFSEIPFTVFLKLFEKLGNQRPGKLWFSTLTRCVTAAVANSFKSASIPEYMRSGPAGQPYPPSPLNDPYSPGHYPPEYQPFPVHGFLEGDPIPTGPTEYNVDTKLCLSVGFYLFIVQHIAVGHFPLSN